jgi:hypothetical protein
LLQFARQVAKTVDREQETLPPQNLLTRQPAISAKRGYSIFGIGVDRKYALKWLFSQEKASLHGSQKVYVYFENALTCNLCQSLAKQFL